jgi:anthranilate/para-aminobenzoate synthase component II
MAYFGELNQNIKIFRNDRIDFSYIEQSIREKLLKGIIISPGPKTPKDCGNSGEIIRRFAGQIPILGICLGHQIIAYEYGGEVVKGKRPMHGKVSPIQNNGKGFLINCLLLFLLPDTTLLLKK